MKFVTSNFNFVFIQMFEDKYMPKVLKDVAKTLNEESNFLKTGHHGDYVVTRSPALEEKLFRKQQQQQQEQQQKPTTENVSTVTDTQSKWTWLGLQQPVIVIWASFVSKCIDREQLKLLSVSVRSSRDNPQDSEML